MTGKSRVVQSPSVATPGRWQKAVVVGGVWLFATLGILDSRGQSWWLPALICTSLVGAWLLIRALRSRVEFGQDVLTIHGVLGRERVQKRDVDRVMTSGRYWRLQFPVWAPGQWDDCYLVLKNGLRVALAQKRVGNSSRSTADVSDLADRLREWLNSPV